MKNQNLYKKDDLLKDEEEPIPEKYNPPNNSPKIVQNKSRNPKNKESEIKSNARSKSKGKISILLNSARKNNKSQLCLAQTTLNNIDIDKFENFDRQNQFYKWQKTYLNLHPDINNTFIERMEFDVVKRHIKEKEINRLIDENTFRIEEEKRAQTFNRLYNDANRRNEAMDNLEKMKNVLCSNDASIEKPIKKYSDEQWKKIYNERFKTYINKIKEKNDIKIKKKLELEIKKENDEINLCKVQKANKKHIKEKSNKMYNEAIKRKMKNKEKSMRVNNNDKNISEIYEVNYSNKKYKNKIKESEYDFNGEKNEINNLNNKSIDISNYLIEKNPSNVHSIKESKNMGKITFSFGLENDQENNDSDNINLIDKMQINNNNINDIDKGKEIIYNFFGERNKEHHYKNEFDNLNTQKELFNDFNNNKIDTNITDDINNNLYIKEVSYIIEQFFLRKNDG